MQIKLDDKYRSQLSTILKLAGFQWGNRGNATAALEAIATGTHKLVPSTGNQGGHEWIETIICDRIQNSNNDRVQISQQ
ncbi:MAG: hypothetical protein HC778_01210 [Chamaesiphon sp. CSU_1_12]|nr:hypothetical protein [Chamaesiphon sp. CSU_1_12]